MTTKEVVHPAKADPGARYRDDALSKARFDSSRLGLELLGQQRKEFATGKGPLRAERTGGSESTGEKDFAERKAARPRLRAQPSPFRWEDQFNPSLDPEPPANPPKKALSFTRRREGGAGLSPAFFGAGASEISRAIAPHPAARPPASPATRPRMSVG